jgi:CheY-like chemotaxis protein
MLNGLRVLIVEDHEDSAVMLTLFLQHKGCDTRSIATAEAALKLVKSWEPHVVLLDLHLRGRSGRWLLNRIRMLPGALGAVPVIATTGDRLRTEEMETFSAMLIKPVDLDQLEQVMRVYAAGLRHDG